MLTNIIHFKQPKEALAAQHRELDTVFNISPDGIAAFNSNGCLSLVNYTFLSMTGFSSEELQMISESEFAKKIRTISVPVSSDAIDKNQLNTLIRIQQGRNHIEHSLHTQHDGKPDTIHPDSNERTLKITMCEPASESISKIMYFHDVTIDMEVNHLKSEFLSTAAHELRTSMSSVYGFTELLLAREFDKVMRTEILQNIHEQSACLVRMLNDLLDLAKIEGRMEKNFHFVVRSLESIVNQASAEFIIRGDNRTINTIFTDEPHLAYIDVDQMKRALTNIICNAFKYSPDGGEIIINICRRINADKQSEVGVLIKDHGIGMTQDEISHVFERFWRGPNTNHIKGSGLGMSLVKEIMDFHHGHVEIMSELGLGTEIGLWFKEHKS